jgi:hypothetical protein
MYSVAKGGASIWTPPYAGKPNLLVNGQLKTTQCLTDAVNKVGKDWVAVATRVPGRTNIQCSARWRLMMHPTPTIVRVGMFWSPEEDAKLIEAVRELGNAWAPVATRIPGRSERQCSGRWRKYLEPAIAGTWTPEDDAKLTDAVNKLGKDWVEVAALVPGRSNMQCSARWRLTLHPNPTKTEPRVGKWAAEEDAKLIGAVTELGNDWVRVATLVPGRSETLCANRWSKYLGPAIYRTGAIADTRSCSRGKWTTEEDAKLNDDVKDWVAVAALVPGRTKPQCRQRLDEILDPTIKGTTPLNKLNKGKWKAEEDAKQTDEATELGKDWFRVVSMVPSRRNVQCRNRLVTYLDPTIEWTSEEDAKLVEAFDIMAQP